MNTTFKTLSSMILFAAAGYVAGKDCQGIPGYQVIKLARTSGKIPGEILQIQLN